MRRAYPQFMAAGGEYLPREVLSIIFPVSYWDLIQKHAARQRPRSLLRGRARRAGVDLRAGHPVLGERRRPDAAHAADGPRLRAQAADCRTRRAC